MKGISNYFKGLAEYDQGIAQADVTFLSDKLKEFDKQATTLSEKLEKDVKAAMTALLVTQAAQVIEESTILGLKIAQQMNPLVALRQEKCMSKQRKLLEQFKSLQEVLL